MRLQTSFFTSGSPRESSRGGPPPPHTAGRQVESISIRRKGRAASPHAAPSRRKSCFEGLRGALRGPARQVSSGGGETFFVPTARWVFGRDLPWRGPPALFSRATPVVSPVRRVSLIIPRENAKSILFECSGVVGSQESLRAYFVARAEEASKSAAPSNFPRTP